MEYINSTLQMYNFMVCNDNNNEGFVLEKYYPRTGFIEKTYRGFSSPTDAYNTAIAIITLD